MNREEAAAVLDAIIFGVYPDDDITINKIGIEAVRFAITALRGPQPDPDTGLVPCGCGGRAVLDGAYGDDEVESSYRTEIYCEQCLIRTPIYTEDEQAKAAWNRAMGYKGGAE